MPSFIGTGADQVPVNSMLGSLAYQNADDVKLGKVTYSGDLLGLGSLGVGTLTPAYKIHAYGTGATIIGVEGTTDASFITRLSGTQALYLHSTSTMSEINELRNVPITVSINGSQVGYWSPSGNLGLGVIPNAWLTGGGFIQVPGNGFIGNNTSMSSNSMLLGSNAYFDTTWKYRTSSLAATFFQAGNGTFSWYTAPVGTAGSAVTFTQAMSLDSSNLILSGTGATKLQEGTTAQRPASPQEGMIRKNSSTGRIEAYYSGAWTTLGRSGAYLEKTLASGYLNGLTEIAGGSISSTADEIVVSFYDVKTSGTTPTYLELSTFSLTSGFVNVSYFCTRVSGTPTPTLQSYSDGMSTGGTKAINLTNWASANDEYSGEIRFIRSISDYAANYDTWSFSGELHCLGSGSVRSNISVSGKFIVSNLASFKFDYIKVKNSTAFTGGRVTIAETKDFSNRT